MDSVTEDDADIVKDVQLDDKFERLLEELGGFGRYQIVVYIMFTLCFMQFTANNNMLVFGSIKPVYTCSKNLSMNSQQMHNYSETSLTCRHLQECPVEYLQVKTEHSFHSLVMEFNLVCSMEMALSTIIAVQMIGLGIGSLMAGKLADSYGRKRIYILSLIPQIILGLAASQSVNWQMFCCLSFVNGLFLGGWATVSFTHMIEHLTSRHRFKINPLGAGTIADLWLTGVAYWTGDWRKLLIVSNVTAIFSIPIIIFAVGESPQWLMHKGHVLEAQKVLSRIGRWNGRSNAVEYSIWKDLLLESEKHVESKEDKETLGFMHLIKNAHLRKVTLTLGYCWFSFNAVIYGLYFNVWTLPGSPYLIYMSMSLLSWLAQFLALLAERIFLKVGRRFLLCVGCMGVLFCACTIIVYMLINNLTDIEVIRFSSDWLITVMAIFACAFTMIPIVTCWTLSTELFPINVRNTAHGLLNACGRLGAILSPYFLLELSHYWVPILYINIFILTFLAMLAVWIILPETKNVSLPSKLSSVSISKKVSNINC